MRYSTFLSLVAGIGIIALFFPLARARAVVLVSDPILQAAASAIAASAAVSAEADASNTLKEYVLDPAVRLIVTLTIQFWTQEIVSWITTGQGSNVGFVQNLEQSLYNVANQRAGEFLNQLAGINLCTTNLKRYLQLKLQLPNTFGNYRYLGAQLSCTMTGIVDNLDTFYSNFENGGWNAFLQVNLVPQNNRFGALLIADKNNALAQIGVVSGLTERMGLGRGFQGVSIPVKSERCEAVSEVAEDEFAPAFKCYTETKTTTPGHLISDSLTKTLADNGFDYSNSSDELSEMLDAAVNQIVSASFQKLMTSVF